LILQFHDFLNEPVRMETKNMFRMKTDHRAELGIYLLGPFRVTVLGKPVDDSQWARPQAKLLLKLLALEPKNQMHRRQIMDVIWPEFDEASAAANLHKIIHMARRALEPTLTSGADSRFILTRSQQVQLTAPRGLWIDVAEFEAGSIRAFRSGLAAECEAAISLYGGDLLSEDVYVEWCARKRDQLRALYHELLMKLGSVYAAQGQDAAAVEQFEKLTASEPSNEEAHRELMRLYVRTGRRSEALRQFKRCWDAVRRELDAEPEERTQQLYRKILSTEIQAVPYRQPSSGNPAEIDTIAVLPFHNETGEADLAYLASGIAESLIKNLSRLTPLRVLAYSTVARYKGRDLNPRRLGRDLKARTLATGRLAKLDGTLTVTAELVDTSDGSVLWGEQYRSTQTDLLKIQEELAGKISAQLKVKFTADERRRMAKQYTADPEAYIFYLKGRFLWNKRTAEGLKKAIEYFEKAIRRDRAYALAYAGLADCYNLLSLYNVMAPNEAMTKAKEAARKALEIDPALAEAHSSLALTHLYYDWDWRAAEREFRKAIELNANYATAHHWYHEYLTALGRFDEQLAQILRAEELDPLSLIINTDVGWGLYYARKYDRAVEQLRRTLELDSNFPVAHLMLALAYAQQHCLDDALASVERSLQLSSDDPLILAVGALGYIHALAGRTREARQVIQRLHKSKVRYASDYCQALVFAGLGEAGAAIHSLERAFELRYDRLIYLKVEPIFDPLRNEPAFGALIRRLGL
jgi:DNA-binding SARP family transcriptional activator/alkylated DNA nucleotide flippase Atl1